MNVKISTYNFCNERKAVNITGVILYFFETMEFRLPSIVQVSYSSQR